MKKRPGILPIKTEIMSINLAIIGVTVLLALSSSLYLSLRQAQQERDDNLMNSAQILSHMPLVSQALVDEQYIDELGSYLDRVITKIADIDVIAVADTDGIQVYYPNRNYIGQLYEGTAYQRILSGGGAFNSTDTGVSGAEHCAYAPVYDRQGTLIGFVMVGIYMRSYGNIVTDIMTHYCLIALVVVILGMLLSTKLSARIKTALMGYEPEAFLRIFHQREDLLEALEEGVLAIDLSGKITYANASASKMLGIPKHVAGRPLAKVLPKSTLGQVLTQEKAQYNLNLYSSKQYHILANHVPIYENGILVGAVAIFRDRTELEKLAENLTGVNHIVDAMRAYTHEFMNKLHVILGLLQLQEYQMAEDYIVNTSKIQQEGISRIMHQIKDPSVAALLLGKASHASEVGVQFILDPESSLTAADRYLPSSAYVTLLGNLIENAIDALNQTSHRLKQITVSIREGADKLLICVEDTGSGMSAEVEKYIFRRGYTTKKGEHGTGLFLVKEIVDSYQGEIRVESEPGVGTTFIVTFWPK